jgi:hypothetical protein
MMVKGGNPLPPPSSSLSYLTRVGQTSVFAKLVAHGAAQLGAVAALRGGKEGRGTWWFST